LRIRREPSVLFVYLVKCAMHYHHVTMAREMALGERTIVNTM
jgi:hypothetical protein